MNIIVVAISIENICILLISILIIISFIVIVPSQITAQSSYVSPIMSRPRNSMPGQNDHVTPIMNAIKVGDKPRAIAVNPVTNAIYVGNLFSKSISVINGLTNKVVGNIKVLDHPDDIAIDPSVDRVYVTNRYAQKVSVINGLTNKVVGNITLGIKPIEIAVDTGTHNVYVANMDKQTVSVINGLTNKVVGNITLGISHGGIALGDMAVNSITHMIYVINNGNILKYNDARVSVINGLTNKVVANVTGVAQYPSHIVIDPHANMIYINNNDANRLSIINGLTNKVEKIIVVDTRPPKESIGGATMLDINPSNNMIYITNSDYGDITIINSLTNRIQKTVTAGATPTGIAVNPSTNKVYVTDEESNTVSIIDGKTNTVLLGSSSSTVPQRNLYRITPIGFKVATGPSSIAVNPSTNKIYVGYASSNKISVFDGNNYNLLKTITVEGGMKKIAVNPSTNKIYVSNQDANNISVIDGDSDNLMGNIPIYGHPFDISVDPFGNVYATSRDSNILSVIDSTKDRIISNVTINDNSSSVSVNQLTHKVYVANRGIVVDPNEHIVYPISNHRNNTVSVIDKAFNDKNEYDYMIVSIIPIKNPPSDIAINPNTNMIYVAGDEEVSFIDGYTNQVMTSFSDFELGLNLVLTVNPDMSVIYLIRGSSGVSAINASSNRILSNITAGFNYDSGAINFNPKTSMVYVTNEEYNTVSAINASSNKVTVGIKFNVDPANSGHIMCNKTNISNNTYIILDLDSQCKAVPNTGFVFSSWSGNLASNFANSSDAIINASNYGSLTASFRQAAIPVSATIPPDFLYGVILGPTVGSITAWLIPFFWDRRDKRLELQAVKTHISIIDRIYESSKQNREECLRSLTQKRVDITKLLEDDEINDSTFQILNDRISQYFDELNNGSKNS